MPKKILTQKSLKEFLHYDPESGVFTRKITTSSNAKIGDIAGTAQNGGYRAIMMFGEKYQAHRLAFLYMKNYMPEQVDHEDHIRDNNCWNNLRDANHQANQRNASMRKDNKSGFCGVHWHKKSQKWQAQIRVDSKDKYLGIFADKQEAIAVRKAANIKHGYHPNHGQCISGILM